MTQTDKKRALVTGAAGFTGRAVVRCFREKGWEVVSVVRQPSRHADETPIDFNAAGNFSKIFDVPRCDAIVHLATHVDFDPDTNPSLFFGTNALAPSLLAQRAKAWQAHLTLTSGTLVCQSAPLVDESTPSDPESPYAKAKLLAEQIVGSAGIDAAILRIAGIFGRHGPYHLGLNKAIDEAIDDARPPTLFGSGAAHRNYVYVEDLAETIVHCATYGKTGTHLVAGRDVLTIRQMLESICFELAAGAQLVMQPGGDGANSVVVPSPELPKGRTFMEALKDIKTHATRS